MCYNEVEDYAGKLNEVRGLLLNNLLLYLLMF